MLVNTVPAVFNDTVIRAALRLRVHYLDMAAHLTPDPFKAKQLGYHDNFARRSRLALINAGGAPRLTKLLVARCATATAFIRRKRCRPKSANPTCAACGAADFISVVRQLF